MTRIINLILVISGLIATSANSEVYHDPEYQFNYAHTELENLRYQLEAIKKVNHDFPVGPLRAQAHASYNSAQDLFKKGYYSAAIRELNLYLNLTQVSNPEQYLSAHYTLGRAYERLGLKSKSIRAFIRYLSSTITAPKHGSKRLSEVLQRVLILSTEVSTTNSLKLKQILSSMLSVRLNEADRLDTLYFAANNAQRNGLTELAEDWYEQIQSQAADQTIVDRARYYDSIIKLTKRDYTAAESLLIANIKDKNSVVVDRSRLALARLYVHKNALSKALQYYNEVRESSSEFADALFEKTFLALQMNNVQDAMKFAEKYQARYHSRADALQIRTLLAYFKLRTGKIAEATKIIDENDSNIAKQRTWINNFTLNKEIFQQDDVYRVYNQFQLEVRQSPTVKLAYQLLESLSEAKRNLFDIRASVSDMYFSVSQLTPEQFVPAWSKRSNQFFSTGERLHNLGRKLVAATNLLVEPHLRKIDKQSLSAIKKRRAQIFNRFLATRDKAQNWEYWYNHMKIAESLKDSKDKIDTIRARSQATAFLEKSGSSPKTDESNLLAHKLNQAHEQLAREQIKEFFRQSPHHKVKRFHRRYANLLNEEMLILLDALDSAKNIDASVVRKANKSWSQWNFVSQRLSDGLEKLEIDVISDIDHVVGKLNKSIKEHDRLLLNLVSLKTSIEQVVSRSIYRLLAHYDGELQKKQAANMKWRADMALLEFDETSKQATSTSEKTQLEQQILQESLTSLEMGVIQ